MIVSEELNEKKFPTATVSCARAIEVLCGLLLAFRFVLPPQSHRFPVQPSSFTNGGFRNQEFGIIHVVITAIGYKLELMPHLSYS